MNNRKSNFAFTFDRKAGPGVLPIMCVSEFRATDDGLLEHYTDDRLRAIVPPEGWDAYAEQWPDAAPVVGELKGRPVVEKFVFFAGEAIEKGAELKAAELEAAELEAAELEARK